MKYKKIKVGILGATLLSGASFGAVELDNRIDPYLETSEKYEISSISTVPEAGENKVEIIKDRPEVRLKKWNGEIDLGIKYNSIQATGSRAFLTNRVEWKGAKEEVHVYPLEAKEGMEDGGFEIEVVLNEKPTTNIFQFELENWENLDFWYQPELTPEEIAEGSKRPENVIGSYAIYHKTKANHRIGNTNYATGKVYHIYRPKVTDANGNKIWGELNIDEASGLLTVTIDQTWLDNAVYPVIVDPTFGYTSVGVSRGIIGNPRCNVNASSIYTASTGDTITGYSAYGDNNNDGDNTIGITSYTIVSGGASTRLHAAETINVTNVIDQWNSVSGLSYSLSNGVDYGIAVGNAAGTGAVITNFDTLTGSIFDRDNTNATLPANWSHTDYTALQLSIYATYTASGGAASGPSTDDFILITE